MKIKKISEANVRDLLWKLRGAVWDQNTARTAPEDSPHHGLSDIWARYAPLGVDGSQPHKSIWYDTPLTEDLKALACQLVSLVNGTELGGVLITRIPPGAICKPHTLSTRKNGSDARSNSASRSGRRSCGSDCCSRCPGDCVQG